MSRKQIGDMAGLATRRHGRWDGTRNQWMVKVPFIRLVAVLCGNGGQRAAKEGSKHHQISKKNVFIKKNSWEGGDESEDRGEGEGRNHVTTAIQPLCNKKHHHHHHQQQQQQQQQPQPQQQQQQQQWWWWNHGENNWETYCSIRMTRFGPLHQRMYFTWILDIHEFYVRLISQGGVFLWAVQYSEESNIYLCLVYLGARGDSLLSREHWLLDRLERVKKTR